MADNPLQKLWKDFKHTTRRYTSHLWRFPETRKILIQVVLRRPLFFVKWLFTLIVIIGIPILLLKFILWGYSLPFTGFNEHNVPDPKQYQPAKTLWDWLQLLIIPSVLAVAGTIFNHLFDARSRDIASDQQQETALQDYLREMSNVLTTDHSRESGHGSSLKDITRARTLIVLPGLNPLRKGRILRFLYETGLISGKDEPFVNLYSANFSNLKIHETKLNVKYLQMTGTRLSLKNANLQGAILRDASLEQIDLRGACLENAYCSNVDLNLTWLCNKASLKKARLNGSNLYRACLRGAQMQHAQLRGAYLREADLRTANLHGADLRAANLQKAHLEKAYLQGVNLGEADLRDAQLQEADLRGTDLQSVQLQGANLLGAKLYGVKLTDEQRKIASRSGAEFKNCEDVPQALEYSADASGTHDHNWQLQYRVNGHIEAIEDIKEREIP